MPLMNDCTVWKNAFPAAEMWECTHTFIAVFTCSFLYINSWRLSNNLCACKYMYCQRCTTLDLTRALQCLRQLTDQRERTNAALTLILSHLVSLMSTRKGLITAGSRSDSCLGNTLLGGIFRPWPCPGAPVSPYGSGRDAESLPCTSWLITGASHCIQQLYCTTFMSFCLLLFRCYCSVSGSRRPAYSSLSL